MPGRGCRAATPSCRGRGRRSRGEGRASGASWQALAPPPWRRPRRCCRTTPSPPSLRNHRRRFRTGGAGPGGNFYPVRLSAVCAGPSSAPPGNIPAPGGRSQRGGRGHFNHAHPQWGDGRTTLKTPTPKSWGFTPKFTFFPPEIYLSHPKIWLLYPSKNYLFPPKISPFFPAKFSSSTPKFGFLSHPNLVFYRPKFTFHPQHLAFVFAQIQLFSS